MTQNNDTERSLIDRRQLLHGGLTAAALVASRKCWALAATAKPSALPEPQRRTLAILCDLTIPVTDTPGALAVGVPAFIEFALQHGLGNLSGDPAQRLAVVEQVGKALDTALGAPFNSAVPDRQFSALEALDADAFKGDGSAPWRQIKSLILLGYYSSEVGASKELRYELVPGRWDPDLPVLPGMRAFSSDWTAVEFG